MGQPPSMLDTTGAILLLLWVIGMWAAVAVLAVAGRRRVHPWLFRGAAAVIFLGVIGQLGHIQEHFAQTGYWVINPNDKPWMTPWGTGLADGMGQVDPSKPSLGMEILHFTGNLIFLAGMVGIMLITRRALATRARTWAKMGTWMQGIHGLEHAALTLSIALGAKQAIGLSTWFGLLDPGPGLWTYRIWWHMLANLVGTIIFAIALYHLWRERPEIEASHQIPATTPHNAPPTRSPNDLATTAERGGPPSPSPRSSW